MTTPNLGPYPIYKPSGVECLGAAPSHWDVVQLGRIGTFSKGSGGTKEDEVPEGIPCVRYGDLYTTHKSFIRQTRSYVSPTKASAYTPISRGDVLFPTSGETIEEIGKSAVNLIDPQVLCGGDLIVFHPTVEIEPKFSGYALDCHAAQAQKSSMGRGITIMHIYSGQLKYLWMPLPPLAEQAAIVRYLDEAEERIQAYTTTKEKLITLLEEQRQAIIHQAVIRGLDPNVTLKPSGVDWLGDLPEHWSAIQIGRVGTFSKGSGGTKEDQVANGIPCIRYGDLYTTHKYFVEQSRGFIPLEKTSNYTPIQRGDILFPASGETIEEIGKSAVNLIEPPIYCGGDVIIFRPKVPMDPRFSGYALDSTMAQDQKSRMGRGVSIMHIYSNHLKYLWVAIPPINEQEAVSQYIDEKTSTIGTTISHARRQIELMEEYRTRLIADVVTGKLDVRKAAEELPEFEPTEATD